MPLIKDQIEIPLTAGIDTFSDPKQAQRMGTSENVYVDREGEITRRPGLEAYSSSQTVDDAYRNVSSAIVRGYGLLPFRDRPLIIGKDAHTRTVNKDGGSTANVPSAENGYCAVAPVDDTGSTNWYVLGEHQHIEITPEAGIPADAGAEGVAYTTTGDYEMFAWLQEYYLSGTIYWYLKYAIRRLSTGAWVKQDTTLVNFSGGATERPFFWVDKAQKQSSTDYNFVVAAIANDTNTFRIYYVVPDTGAATSIANITTESVFAAAGPVIEGTKQTLLVVSRNASTNKIRMVKYYGDGNVARAANDTAIDAGTGVVGFAWPDENVIPLVQEDSNTLYFYFMPNEFGAGATALATASNALSRAGATYFSLGVASSPLGSYNRAYVGPAATHTTLAVIGGATTEGLNFYETMHVWYDHGAGTAGVHTQTVRPGAQPLTRPFIRQVEAWAGGGAWYGETYVLASVVGNSVANDATDLYTKNRIVLEELRILDLATDELHWHVIAQLAADNVAGFDNTDTGRRAVQRTPAGSDYMLPVRRLTQLYGKDTSVDDFVARYTIKPIRIKTNYTVPPQYVKSGPDLIIGGARVSQIDGQIQEVGFIAPPEVVEYAGGTLDVSSLWEWVDAFGQRHISSPATGVAANPASANTDIVCPHHCAHRRGTDAGPDTETSTKSGQTRCIYYVTEAGAAQHYRSENDPLGLQSSYPTINEDFSNTQVNDANLTDNELLYTDGGVLENVPPPPSNILLAHKERVFLIPQDDPTSVWSSKRRVKDVGLEFAGELVIHMGTDGDCTGLAALDDYVVVFKENSVYVMAGDGPTATGQGGFATPQKISSSVGCRDSNSVVSYEGGVLFKSNAGWQKLDRSLAITPVGLPVSDYDSYTVWRTLLCPELRQIRVLHDPDDTTTVLVFDYLRNKWDTLKYESAATGTIHDIAYVDGTVMVLGQDGKVWKETLTSARKDDGNVFTPKVVSPWIQTNMLDIQRIWWVKFIGEWDSGSDELTVKFYYDYSDSATDTFSKEITDIESDGSFRLKPSKGICKAFRVEVSGAINRISKILLEVGRRQGRGARLDTPTTFIGEG